MKPFIIAAAAVGLAALAGCGETGTETEAVTTEEVGAEVDAGATEFETGAAEFGNEVEAGAATLGNEVEGATAEAGTELEAAGDELEAETVQP